MKACRQDLFDTDMLLLHFTLFWQSNNAGPKLRILHGIFLTLSVLQILIDKK